MTLGIEEAKILGEITPAEPANWGGGKDIKGEEEDKMGQLGKWQFKEEREGSLSERRLLVFGGA